MQLTKRFYIILLFIITFTLAFNSLAIPPLQRPPDITKQEDSGSIENSKVTNQLNTISKDTSSHDSSSNRISQTYNYFDNNNNSLFQVYKYISNRDNQYFLDSDINITVRILCQNSRNLNDVLLKEEVIPNCIIDNSSKYLIITDPVNESVNGLHNSKWRCFDKKSPSDISTKINTIYPFNWIEYTYTIHPTEEGWHNLDTIIKYQDPTKTRTPIYFYSLDRIFITREIPDLFITLDKDKEHAGRGENIQIDYEITYLGEKKDTFKIQVELDDHFGKFFKCNNSKAETLTIGREKPAKFSRSINFSECDEYIIPKLKVNTISYQIDYGDNTVTIETWEEGNSDYIYWLLQTLGLILAFALGYNEFRNLERSLSRMTHEMIQIRRLLKKYNKHLKNLDHLRKL